MYLQRRLTAIAVTLLLCGAAGIVWAGGNNVPTANSSGEIAVEKQAQDLSRLAVSLFNGQVGDDSNIELSGWGSGDALATRDVILIGNSGIRITTHGMYQGGRLEFKEPVDLSSALAAPNAYLRFQVRFSGNDSFRSGFSENSFQSTRTAVSPFKQMRFLLVMADGSQHELVRPVEVPPSEDPDQWVPISFPFATLVKQMGGKAPTGDAAKIKQLAIFGDKYQQFYIGEIRAITDSTELSVAPLEEQIYFAQESTVFTASAEGGAATLQYFWDFDASDGLQEDARGRSVVYTFPISNSREGIKKYIVTLTVKDYDGLKKAVSTTLEAEVTD